MSGTGIAGAMDYQPRQAERREARCYVCDGPFKAGASHSARVLPPLVQVCSAACAEDPRFGGSAEKRASRAVGG